MKTISILSFVVAGLLGLAACSSDKSLTITTSNASGSTGGSTAESLPTGLTIPDLTAVTLPPGVTLPTGLTIPELTLPPGLSLPPGLTIPDVSDLTIPDITGITIPDVSIPTASIDPADLADCNTFSLIFAEVFTGSDSGIDDIPAAFEELAKNLPADLVDDLEAVQAGFVKLQAVLAKYDYDYNKLFTDADALAVFSDTTFITGIGNLEQYYGTKCGAVPG